MAMNEPAKQDQERRLRRLERLARMLDSAIPVPGTRLRFGLDALIGLVPVVGDLAGLLLGLYPVMEAWRARVGRATLLRMLGNLGLEALAGMVPILGDGFDIYWQANNRNLALLRKRLEEQLAPPAPAPPKRSSRLFLGTLLALLLVGLGVFWWQASP